MTGEQRSRLVTALMALPAGPWEVWTSCSFRRITDAMEWTAAFFMASSSAQMVTRI